jgi:putative peptidoglycan lipid II flippase
MLTGVSIIILNIVLSIAFYYLTPIGVTGMALAYSISSAVNTVLLVKFLTKRFTGLYLTEGMPKFISATLIATVAMCAILIGYNTLIPESLIIGAFSWGLKLRQVATLLGATILGAGVYFLVISRMDIEEVTMIKAMIKSRFTKKNT